MKSTVTAPREASASNSPGNTRASETSITGITTADASAAPASARLTVDLGALTANYNKLKRLAPRAEVAGVVKAEAYGLGAAPVAKALSDAGCHSFFVATAEEGARLRATLPAGTQAAIYVLHGFAGASPRDLAARALIPVLSTDGDIATLSDFARAEGRRMPAALHADTGMNRLGLPAASLEAGLALDGIAPVLLMSHLACADEPADPLNARQRTLFTALKACFPGLRASLANSAGILLGSPYHESLVRPGIALYGGNPVPAQPHPFRAVATLEAPVLQIREVPAGETVGYGASYAVKAPARLATLGIGYADGYLRSLSSRGSVIIAGHRAPVVGRVSMDLITVDVTYIAPELTRPGAYAELFGEFMPLDEVAGKAGTLSYELLTRLGQRLARRYVPAS